MEKNRLLLLPFLAGLILMGYSWYMSYPLSVDSPTDFVLNHISIFYWISLPLLLASMFLMATTSRSNTLKWGVSVGFVLTLFSLSFFYYRLPGSDSHFFRGLIEYFTRTVNFNPSEADCIYFQWPSFFILAKTVTSLSGLGETSFEFLIFGIISFLFATTLYIYSYRISKNWGFLIVPAFFISMFYFLNYQAVPFTLSFALLFLLFMLEGREEPKFNVSDVCFVCGHFNYACICPPFFCSIPTDAEHSQQKQAIFGFSFIHLDNLPRSANYVSAFFIRTKYQDGNDLWFRILSNSRSNVYTGFYPN